MYKPYVIYCKDCKKIFHWHNRYKKYCLKCDPNKKTNKRLKYPLEFHRVKAFIRVRDKHICQNCNKDVSSLDPTKKMPPVHHIDGDINNNDTINLVTLCDLCHLLIHRQGLKRFKVKRIKIPKEKDFVKIETKKLFKGI